MLLSEADDTDKKLKFLKLGGYFSWELADERTKKNLEAPR